MNRILRALRQSCAEIHHQSLLYWATVAGYDTAIAPFRPGEGKRYRPIAQPPLAGSGEGGAERERSTIDC